MPTLTANSDASSAYAVAVSRRGWISCAVAIRATEILLSARSGSDLGATENDDVEPDEVDQSAVPDLLPEDTEMEALHSRILGEERDEPVPVRQPTQHQLEMPDIRRTPVNEFNRSQALLSMAFPTLFPRGQAEFVEPRLRPIKYSDYIQHALRWHDGRFARHPTFRFVVFNTLMRAQARAKSSYFVKQHHQRRGPITRDDLLEAFQNPESADAQQLLNSINRQTAQLRGTRPYWYRKRRELESYAYNLDSPGAFITFTPADLHWRSLYQHLPQFQDWQELPEQQRMGMSSKLLRDNPHIAAWHFYRRFGLFRDIVLKQKFNVTDYWNRYEWQGRGSSHCHGLFWMDGAPSVDLENEHTRKEFVRIWGSHVTALNPEPARVQQQGEGNPLAVNPLRHPLTFQWLSQILNRCQRHHCSETYCLRKKKDLGEISCRFFFPRGTRDTADVVRRQGQSYFSFEATRNDSLMNHYNRCLSLGWLANIDISPCTSLQAVINYAAKYCSKMERRTDSYASLGRQILPYVSHHNPLLSFASRLMNKLLAERDFSGQEICHVLLNCELQEGTRVVRAVDCRPYEQQGRSLRLQGDHDDAEVVGIYDKYLSRPLLHEELTYLDFLANWNTSKRDGTKWTRWGRQAKPRVLYYFPRYSSNRQHDQYDDFCRVKLMLAHPHRDPNQLRKVNGVEYASYALAAEFCYGNHQHPDDYYGTPNTDERRPDPDQFEREFYEPDLVEEDWLELARQLPDCPPSQEAIDLLGRRDIDIQYDWTPHVGRYADPGIVQGDYWRQRIEQDRLDMDVEDLPLEVRDTLNPEQRIVYDTFVGHFQCGSEEQILLHVDGGGGTGKSYMIKVLSSHLQRLAGDRPSPIWRAAPTGVASHQIMGTTLHSLLRLPVDRAFTELSPADANAIQKKLRDVRYLVIDEKSMLGLRQLSWVDKRLRQVFPGRAADFFGGMSIILVGDFFQLPPVANKPLYFDGPLKDLHEVSGQAAYRAFNHTVFLKKVERQQGDDQAGFRLALEELRGLRLSIESWKLLSQRVQAKLSQCEVDKFDTTLRIYSKKARVNEYNYDHLVRLKQPAIQVMAKNIGNGADKATSEQAGNLAGQFPPIYNMTMRTQGWGTSGGHGRLWEVMTGMEYILEHLEDWKLLYEDETANHATEERRRAQGEGLESVADTKSMSARPSVVGQTRERPLRQSRLPSRLQGFEITPLHRRRETVLSACPPTSPLFNEGALPVHSRGDYLQDDARSVSNIASMEGQERASIRASINAAWIKLNEYYTLLGRSPLFAASIVLNPDLGLRWLETNWTSPEQLQWLRDAKDGIKAYFERWYSKNDDDASESISATSLTPRPEQSRVLTLTWGKSAEIFGIVTIDLGAVSFRVWRPDLTVTEQRRCDDKALKWCKEAVAAVAAVATYFPPLHCPPETITSNIRYGKNNAVYVNEGGVEERGMTASVMCIKERTSGLVYGAKEPYFKVSDDFGKVRSRWEELKKEFDNVAALDHPHIVRAIELVMAEDKKPVMLLDWIGAGSEPRSNPVQTWGRAASSISRTDPVHIVTLLGQ
ncbi:hypothetical protein HZS61_008310 [Fusarium oxysporum f. sp. conglutinans]|uniref:ATP-dependent DNA helicase n=2 Tax=Fusarium oxysporum f. sp. conglutinans TaxID=100902 RepID=A0A8H6H0S0_FUSOX|nr:hypothetical protein HZS61_008310 [Fusarium oxysporum f. sp. conglutinans]